MSFKARLRMLRYIETQLLALQADRTAFIAMSDPSDNTQDKSMLCVAFLPM